MLTNEETLRLAQRTVGVFLTKLINQRASRTDLLSLQTAATQLRLVMDNTEEGPRFDKAHHFLDLAGSLLHEHFANFHCALRYSEGTYSRVCPVDLGHIRVGLSVGFTARVVECSICANDPEECDHVRGFEYNGQICVRRVLKADLHEVSLVDRPAQPQARIMALSLSNSELHEGLGAKFKPGVRVACNKCEGGCLGLKRPLLETDGTSERPPLAK